MRKVKAEKIKKHGWKIGSAADFLALSDEEAAYVEMKVALAQYLRRKRRLKHLTQEEMAKLISSSQSRVAKMEAGDPSVSIDLLIRSLIALGASKKDLAKIISASHFVKTT